MIRIHLKEPEHTFNKIMEKKFPIERRICLSRHKKLTEHRIDLTRKESPCAI